MKINRAPRKYAIGMIANGKRLGHHTKKIRTQMRFLIDHLRKDVKKITEPKAQALCETSAEVLTGLVKAFDDYEEKRETAWRTGPAVSRPKTRGSRVSRRQNQLH